MCIFVFILDVDTGKKTFKDMYEIFKISANIRIPLTFFSVVFICVILVINSVRIVTDMQEERI